MIKNGTIELTLQSEVTNNFRCKMAADSLDIDVHKKSIHHLKIENVAIPSEWNIGLFYGNSGSGKTTLAKHIFGNDCFKSILDEDQPIINQFPADYDYKKCADLLSGIGLNSVPCWIRPVKTLSNGQKARAEAALLMCQTDEVIVIDEWTSVVDRTVAKAMSLCLSKFAKKHNKKIIILSCHYDILEWLVPDWMIDCNEQKFILKQHENFFFTEREQITFEIRKSGRDCWKYFSKYHYLSDKLPGGEIHIYGLFINNQQIGFKCFANYTPLKNPLAKKIFHANRLVIHPDYQGLQLGLPFSELTNDLFIKEKRGNVRVMAKFSAIPVYKILLKSKKWKYLGTKRMMGAQAVGINMSASRKNTFRDSGSKSFLFEYIA